MSEIRAVPIGYHTVTPYLIVDNAAEAIEFYKKAFNAIELLRMPMPNGRIAHAEIRIGNSAIMLADECPERSVLSPSHLGGSGVGLCLYVDDADLLFDQAVNAGATVEKPMELMFWGDRSGTVSDKFGHSWTIMTHVEDVTPEEMARRFAKLSQE